MTGMRWRPRRFSWLSSTTWRRTLLGLVLLYAFLLRYEALIGKWAPVEGPPWTQTLQVDLASTISHIRPSGFKWDPEPYLWGDPYDDLESARQMESFYTSGPREPVNVVTVRILQGLLGDQDLVVCIVSGVFSVLSVLMTYLIGNYLFSWGVGFGAALGLAIERDVISAGVLGSRDDAFTFFLLLFVYTILRARDEPTWRLGLFAGLAAAGACLTRITALTFVIPAVGYLALIPNRERRARGAAVAGVIVMTTVVVAPFLLYCWLEYGNPFYSISRLTPWYQERLDGSAQQPANLLRLMWTALSVSPFAFLDTTVRV